MNDESQRLPFQVTHGYGVGALSLSFCNTTIMFFVAKFLLDEAGLSANEAAAVVFIAKGWDAISDPLVGGLSDRTRSSMGVRRPWLLWGTVPMMLLFSVLWMDLPVDGVMRAVAYGAVFVLFSTAYTAVVVPYGAITPALTPDYDERTRLNGARMVWSMLGGIVAGITVPMLREVTGSYGPGAWLLALLGIGPLMVTVWATRGRDRVLGDDEKVEGSFLSMWSVLWVRPFRRVALLFLAAWSTISVLSALVPFYAEVRLGRPDLVDVLFAAIQFSAMVSIPFVIWLAGKTEKHVAYAVSVVAWAVVLMALAFIPKDAITLVVVAASLVGPGVAAAHVLPWSMLPDVVEADKAETGEERAGAFYGMMTFLEKVGTALALNAMLLALGAAGYVSSVAGETVTQPAAVETTVQVLLGPIPGVVLLAAAAFAWLRPPVTRAAHEALVKKAS